jgi:hypothetical protein
VLCGVQAAMCGQASHSKKGMQSHTVVTKRLNVRITQPHIKLHVELEKRGHPARSRFLGTGLAAAISLGRCSAQTPSSFYKPVPRLKLDTRQNACDLRSPAGEQGLQSSLLGSVRLLLTQRCFLQAMLGGNDKPGAADVKKILSSGASPAAYCCSSSDQPPAARS